MTTAKSLLLWLTLTVATTTHAACPYPQAPENLPNGETATKEEMITAQNAVKDYVAAVEAYLACLNNELVALGDAATEEHKLMRHKRHNAAVDYMENVADSFNVAVRAYKARQN